MKENKLLFKSCACILMLAALCLSSCTPKNKYIAIQGYAQGGTYTVKINLIGDQGKVKVSPDNIKNALDSIFNVIDTTLSGYNKGSMLSRMNAGKIIRPNAMFEDLYAKSYGFWKETDGALDVAAAPLFDKWGFGFTTDSLPSDHVIWELLGSIGMKRLKPTIVEALSPDGSLNPINLINAETMANGDFRTSPELNFNAVAQGYTCDVIAAYLRGIGVKDMLVDVGEIYCNGVNPDGKPWSVGVDRPFDGNETPGKDLDGIWQSNGSSCGIVTSGNYRKFYIKNGKKYSHTIDPRTGYPVQHSLLSATIVAKDATSADAYATYCMVIGLEKAKEFIESRSDELQGYLIYDDNGSMKEWASKGFNLIKANQ
jgi:thiamine biosynthesis lipoprotein